jgi:hypothetical protein
VSYTGGDGFARGDYQSGLGTRPSHLSSSYEAPAGMVPKWNSGQPFQTTASCWRTSTRRIRFEIRVRGGFLRRSRDLGPQGRGQGGGSRDRHQVASPQKSTLEQGKPTSTPGVSRLSSSAMTLSMIAFESEASAGVEEMGRGMKNMEASVMALADC